MDPSSAKPTSSSSSSSGSAPLRCAGGCGFFGSAAMQGMCSVCFKKAFPSTPALSGTTGSTLPPRLDGLSLGGSATPTPSSPAPAAGGGGGGGAGAIASGSAPAHPPTLLSSLSLTRPPGSAGHGPSPLSAPSSAAKPPAASAPAAGDDDVVMGGTGSASVGSGTSAPPPALHLSGAAAPGGGGVGASAGSAPTGSGGGGGGVLGGGAGGGLSTPVRGAGAGSGASGVGSSTPATGGGGAGGDGGDGTPGGAQKNKSRCFSCRKKVGLTGFECKCGFVFCGEHRYADQHACTFDYVTHDRTILAKANQKVVADKLEKF